VTKENIKKYSDGFNVYRRNHNEVTGRYVDKSRHKEYGCKRDANTILVLADHLKSKLARTKEEMFEERTKSKLCKLNITKSKIGWRRLLASRKKAHDYIDKVLEAGDLYEMPRDDSGDQQRPEEGVPTPFAMRSPFCNW
jgi:hypothetical protein